jgi:hypothetical protein
LIYNKTIPFVVRLSNHERNCDTVLCALLSARRQFLEIRRPIGLFPGE